MFVDEAGFYLLTAGVWTQDLGRAHRMAARLEAGLVAVNSVNSGRLGLPFGERRMSFNSRRAQEATREAVCTLSGASTLPRIVLTSPPGSVNGW